MREPSGSTGTIASHVARGVVAVAVILLCTVLPFLPGRHDPLAVPLSQLALFTSRVLLLLVPVGLAWLVYESSGRRERAATTERSRARGYLAAATLAAASVILLAATVGAWAAGGLVLGVLTVNAGALAMLTLVRRAAGRWREREAAFVALPLTLVLVPVSVLALQRAIAGPVYEASRDRAIRNAGAMIAAIERHRATRGAYPPSLLSVWGDFDPSVAGIDRYRYEPSGDGYNLAFEQPTFVLGLREFVVYNPRDEQAMTSHDRDLLELSGASLDRQRGFFASGPTPHPHWKFFRFD
jgi:hypothetical protein